MSRHAINALLTAGLLLLLTGSAVAQEADESRNTERGDQMIASYFEHQTARLEEASLANVKTLEDWEKQKTVMHGQLLDMLGLNPLPTKTKLKPVVTGITEHEEFTVEQVQFQSRPGLYVTGNLYIPRNRPGPLPAILYVCGHGRVKIDGVSYGNKVHYQHHGGWFARNGYVCLTIDTLQLGEIEGIHHGTYREDMWWWVNRGYTPAGVEAWNCVRSLDYLQSRPEVDGQRLGVSGRSGGGAYSWWIAAIDERVKVAVPVAGITDLRNHVVDGCVEGHCDCMYMLNTFQWDYAQVAALVAPRPLLISNTDRDGIFPVDGVFRIYQKVRKIYELYDAGDKLALHVTAGPHKDTQELRVHAFRWFNFHLQEGKTDLLETTAVKFFEPPQLKVFDQAPADQRNTTIHETFVPLAAPAAVPSSPSDWKQTSRSWMQELQTTCFGGWPATPKPIELQQATEEEVDNVTLRVFEFDSQEGIRLPLIMTHRKALKRPSHWVVQVLDEEQWNALLATYGHQFVSLAKLATADLPDENSEGWLAEQKRLQQSDSVTIYFPPRGIGPTAWDPAEFKQNQHQRRFYLLGQTLDGMRTWDVRRAIQAVRTDKVYERTPMSLESHGSMAGITLYASLFEENISRLTLHQLPTSHRQGPYFLNVRRILDIPQAVAMAAKGSQLILHSSSPDDWKFATQTVKQLGWDASQILFPTADK